MGKTISDLILEYFKAHPNKDLRHGPVVDWVEEQYIKLYGRKPRDIWRSIRRLHQEGVLIKLKNGVYRYAPSFVHNKELHEFTSSIKEVIFKRDNYRCVVCGRGKDDGVEIHVDHKVPLDKGGTNDVDNGQTLCSEHNLLKKNYSQTELGKKFLTNLYKDAVKKKDKRMIKFCKEIFDVYDKYEINSHIPRPDGK